MAVDSFGHGVHVAQDLVRRESQYGPAKALDIRLARRIDLRVVRGSVDLDHQARLL